MALDPTSLPDDIARLKAMLLASAARADALETRATAAEARSLDLDAQIANLKLTIAKMKRADYGASSEKSARLIDQLEMQLGELVATASEGKVATAIERPMSVSEETQQKPARRPLDEKLPRERVVHAAPCACRHCGSERIRRLDEKITETLEHVPASWKVIQHVREVFSCRDCDKIVNRRAILTPLAG